jgi:hypothetical protein
MTRVWSSHLVAVLLCVLSPALWATGTGQYSLYVTGHAFDDDGEALLYREVHRCNSERSRCVIEYVDPGQQPLARKELDYSDSAHAPDVTMRNLLAESLKTARGGDDTATVIDAGFDNYVRSRWDELAAGNTVEFPFLVLGRDQPLAMQAARRDGDCTEDALCLAVTPQAWYLRLVVPPIELTYARDSRRLLRYQGIGNLRDAQGNSRQVDIRYDYADAPMAAAEIDAN